MNISSSGIKELGVYDSDLKAFDEKNKYTLQLDRFCVDYVATTRAVQQMFFYLKKTKNKENIGYEIYDYVTQFSDGQDSFDLYEEDDSYYKIRKKNELKQNEILISQLKNNQNGTDKIKIATPSKKYQNKKEKVKRGLLMHSILEKIEKKSDVEKILFEFESNGEILQQELNDIRRQINDLINHPENEFYFSDDLNVMTERELFHYDDVEGKMKEYRIDRLLEKDGAYYIVDFKTGKENKNDEKQIENYQSVLQKLGKKVSGRKIIYL